MVTSTCRSCNRYKLIYARGFCKYCYTKERPFSFKRLDVLRRDNYGCRDCGKTGRLDIHHVDFNKKNNDIENLITVCASCHTKRHVFSCVLCGKIEFRKSRRQKYCSKCRIGVIKEKNRRNWVKYKERHRKLK